MTARKDPPGSAPEPESPGRKKGHECAVHSWPENLAPNTGSLCFYPLAEILPRKSSPNGLLLSDTLPFDILTKVRITIRIEVKEILYRLQTVLYLVHSQSVANECTWRLSVLVALIIVELIKSSLYSSISIPTKSVKERKDPAGQLQSCSASFFCLKSRTTTAFLPFFWNLEEWLYFAVLDVICGILRTFSLSFDIFLFSW